MYLLILYWALPYRMVVREKEAMMGTQYICYRSKIVFNVCF